jgi:hypothetical protein
MLLKSQNILEKETENEPPTPKTQDFRTGNTSSDTTI